MLATDLQKKIQAAGQKIYFVFGDDTLQKHLVPLDLSVQNKDFLGFNVTTFEGLDGYVRRARKEKAIPFGGYGEHRAIYEASEHFQNDTAARCIHLGVDLWTAAETTVFMPLDGFVHSFRYNSQRLDYGATIITEHHIGDAHFFLLFGHLSKESLKNLEKGDLILGGMPLATLGTPAENGGWSPHLHLQIITKIDDWEGDFPGVATRQEAASWLQICPNPYFLIGK